MNYIIEENQFNFIDYIQQMLNLNEGSLGQSEDMSKSVIMLPGNKIKDNYKSSIIWLFRKINTLEDFNGQYEMITMFSFITRHVFLYLLTLIHYNKDHQPEIISLMKSIGIINKNNKLLLTIETSTSLENQSYNVTEIIQQKHINKNDYEFLIKCWAQIKEEQYQQYLNLLNQNHQLSFLFTTLNFQLNRQQEKKLREKQDRERKKRRSKLMEQKLAKTQQKTIITLKVSYQKQKKQLIILPIGNLIKSKQSRIYNFFPVLNLDYKSEITQFRKSQFTLNQLFSDNQLFSNNDIIIYTGQVDELYQPNSYGKMSDKAMKLIYQGGFKNGLFNGNGEIIKYNQLHYSGQFENGQKHGMFYRLQEQQNQPSNIYFKGEYYQEQRQGIFEEYKLESIGSKLQFVKFGNKQYKFDKGQQVTLDTNIPSIIKFNPSTELFHFEDFKVNNFSLETLLPGRWIKKI